MRYLIFGINGMAGHMIGTYLMEKKHQVIGVARQKSSVCKTKVCDISDKGKVKGILEEESYDVVINCIGKLNKFVDEKLSEGIYVNSEFPHWLAEQLENTDKKLIHLSTDCVFEGTKGSYTESDIPDATSYYGRSKLLGEVIDNKNLTLRTSIIGPELKSNGIGLYHWFMQQQGKVSGFEKAIWSGVTTLQLAKVIEQDAVLQQTGLYHLSNNQKISKYKLLQLFNQYCRKDRIEIEKNTSFECDKSIINTRQKKYEIPTYEEMICDMGKWMKEHKDIYKNYEV
ncbi:dTDP-4-dehydrorhamnose reductase family protein [Lachnospira hominis (ex Liu et al. 2021)]|uniref:dTDP-4-dehydrorhamnose reductase n=1 Tax=Lachnospira hominis (ex Liu et al. 2021) TaxID=2763051 RepID=A0ABR7G3X8_9FIRM|nr:SDR family oxidoreductase [Lachnospira hominis]MBC5681610.1 SDR family oxidoreductase [Lachnospira hominis]